MTKPMTDFPVARPRRGRRSLATALGLAVLYGTSMASGNAAEVVDCAPSQARVDAMQPLARGEVAAVQVAKTPKPLPNLSFIGPEGQSVTLADLRGRTLVVNLWATWCVPCRKEMPALDALQGRLGGPDFQVVAINIDTRNLDRPRTWLAEAGVTKLAYYADPAAKVFQELKTVGKAFGMPTTLVVDPRGCELATLAGPAEWSGEDALKLLAAAMGK
jgi:thiol-disulfide isomerase/thioredoxin